MSFLKNIFTSMFRIHYTFFTYFKSMNSKITGFEIWWGPNLLNFSKFR
jgi:hypothetical protein